MFGRAPKGDHHHGSGKKRRAAAASGHQRNQAHGQEGVRVDPSRAAHDAGLDVGDVGSDRYHHALGYLPEEAALLGDEHTAFDVGEEHPHGYALYFFTQRAMKVLEE